jgi:hypothetical protein
VATPHDPEPASDWAELVEAISDHVERHLGPIHQVLHELVSDDVHIDLHWVQPRPDRPFHTLVTSGMSEHPMAAPKGAEGSTHAELVLNLPAGWPMSKESWNDERHWWPMRLLKQLARVPHQQDTWLWMNHTAENPDGGPYGPGTEQCAVLIGPCLSAPPDFQVLEFGGRDIHFFSVIPLHRDELSYKIRKGSAALYDRFDEAGMGDVVMPGRPSACGPPRKGLLRWFRN